MAKRSERFGFNLDAVSIGDVASISAEVWGLSTSFPALGFNACNNGGPVVNGVHTSPHYIAPASDQVHHGSHSVAVIRPGVSDAVAEHARGVLLEALEADERFSVGSELDPDFRIVFHVDDPGPEHAAALVSELPEQHTEHWFGTYFLLLDDCRMPLFVSFDDGDLTHDSRIGVADAVAGNLSPLEADVRAHVN